VLGIFLDVSKAFQNFITMVSDKFLLIGFVVKANRSQHVLCNKSTSDSKQIEFRVPQDFILGPLLFLI